MSSNRRSRQRRQKTGQWCWRMTGPCWWCWWVHVSQNQETWGTSVDKCTCAILLWVIPFFCDGVTGWWWTVVVLKKLVERIALLVVSVCFRLFSSSSSFLLFLLFPPTHTHSQCLQSCEGWDVGRAEGRRVQKPGVCQAPDVGGVDGAHCQLIQGARETACHRWLRLWAR